MTRQEKQDLEQSKPINERNYWRLSKEEKTNWLSFHKLNKWKDIIIPIILLSLSFLVFLFSLILLCLKKPAGVTAMSILTFLFLLPIIASVVYWMIIKNKGIFIYKYWKPKKPSVANNSTTTSHSSVSSSKPVASSSEPVDLDLL